MGVSRPGRFPIVARSGDAVNLEFQGKTGRKIGPLDPNTKIGGYTLLNARVEWNNIAGSKFHAAAYVRNMLNRRYEVGGIGLGAIVGVDAVILGTPRLAAVELGLDF